MIPKRIHCCWLSDEPLPRIMKKCKESWERHLPDYEIITWDRRNFDTDSIPFVKQACDMQKWAFASDYIRAHAVHTMGGVYFDLDVLVRRDISEFLSNSFFSAIEFHPGKFAKPDTPPIPEMKSCSQLAIANRPAIGIQAAIFGAEAGHPYLNEVMDWYRRNSFLSDDGQPNEHLLAPTVYAMIAEEFGLKLENTMQRCAEDMLIFSTSTFAGNPQQTTPSTYAVHCCAGSWRPASLKRKLRQLSTSIGWPH